MRTDTEIKKNPYSIENHMQKIINGAKKISGKNLAAVFPDNVALRAIENSINESIINHVFLIGPKEYLNTAVKSECTNAKRFTIIDSKITESEKAATLKAVELTKSNEAHMLMKGKMNTASFVKGILDKKNGIGSGRRLSLVCIFQVPGIDRHIILTDPGINPALFSNESSNSCRDIVYNAVDVALSLDIKKPKVALIGANEIVSDSVKSSVIIRELSKKTWDRCELFGPLSYDIALYKKYADKKGLSKNRVAGCADIIIPPDIVSANVIYKSWITTAKALVANIVPGADVPLIISSRSDSDISKFLTICSSVIYSDYLYKKIIKGN